MRRHQIGRAVVGVSLVLGCALCVGQTPDAAGKVEVREGDSWTKVTQVRKEGRRTLVRYDDGTEEWVTADRLRAVGGASTPTPTPAAGASDRPSAGSSAETAGGKRSFAVGDQVEHRGTFNWEAGKVERIDRGWFLVKDAHDGRIYWLEPWMLRLPGATYDIPSQWPKRGNPAMPGEAAPTVPPDAAPQSTGNPFETGVGAASGGQDAGGARGAGGVTLAGPFTEFTYDTAQDPQPAKEGASVSLPTTRPAWEFRSCTVRPKYTRINTIVPCCDTPDTALVVFGLFMDEPAEIARMDTVHLSQRDKRILEPAKQRVVGAAERGDVILTVPNEGFPKTMHIWRLAGGTYKLQGAYKPLVKDNRYIIQATLLDATHAVVVDNAEEAYLLDLAQKKATGFVRPKRDTRVYVHPSGKLLGVLTTSGTALLVRADDFSVVAECNDAAGRGEISVDPSGTAMAYLTSANSVRVVKIADGSTLGSVAVTATSGKELDLLSPETLLLDHKTTYDVKTGMPIWIYNTPTMNTATLLWGNGQMLFATVEGELAAVCQATLPDSAARNAVKKLSNDSFVVKPGTAVNLQANFAAFGAESAKAEEIVRNAITSAGLVISDQPQPFCLNLTAAPGPTERRDLVQHRWGGPPIAETVSVPCNIVKATLSEQNKPLWAQEIRYEIGGMVSVERGQSLQDAANKAAQLTAEGLKQLAVPGYLPKGATPGSPAALGASDLTVRGFVPAAKPAAPSPTPTPSLPPRMGPGRPGERQTPGKNNQV